ncbi:MAG: D-alanyl-D-alanine endopeptidase [Porticoccaceae bacterium]|jgi:D-alanyl-D-alanine endopeptidase (penicillin-binding protein 7)
MTIKKVLICLTLALPCGAYAGSSAYKVVRGDTLFGIAKSFNTSVPELLAHNGLSSHRIVPGQTLKIPSQSGADNSQERSYTVRSGDSLSAIASSHGVSLETLRSHNRIKGSLLHPGQVLFIPEGNDPYTAPANKQTVAVHNVRRGDTLWDIAKHYRVSVASISRFNGIAKNAALIPGQSIRIPSGGLAHKATASSSTYLAKGAADPRLESRSVMIIDALSGTPLYQKNANAVKPIASITKLMTAMVTLDANLAMDEPLTIDTNDLDRLKGTGSRLPMGTKLSRYDMLHLALMSSENRAASALSRHYPGGKTAFLAAMNSKAKALGMSSSFFADATGLNPKNVSTAEDLAKLVAAASKYDLIRNFTTDQEELMRISRVGTLQYRNTNPLVRQGDNNIALSKTGYINEAGRCLVMKTTIGSRPAYMVFLQSGGKYSPISDAKRVKQWIESGAAGINLAAL